MQRPCLDCRHINLNCLQIKQCFQKLRVVCQMSLSKQISRAKQTAASNAPLDISNHCFVDMIAFPFDVIVYLVAVVTQFILYFLGALIVYIRIFLLSARRLKIPSCAYIKSSTLASLVSLTSPW